MGFGVESGVGRAKESQGEDESETSTWAVWCDRFPSTEPAFSRGKLIVEAKYYERDLVSRVSGRLRRRGGSRGSRMEVVGGRAKRADQALMTDETRFETPLIQRDAFDALARDRRVVHSSRAHPCDAFRGVNAAARLPLPQTRTVHGPSVLARQACRPFFACTVTCFPAWQCGA